MNTFKRKSLHAAVLAGLGAVGMAGTANAVHINPDGTGQVLLYPYYTVRADGGGTSTAYYDNYISVVNSTNSTKAVKVRFLESRNSREVLDFNLFLSPFDVWTGGVVRTADGARLISSDRSCVVPNALFTQAGFSDFKSFAYENLGDGAGTTLDRTREGYFEMIEMGVVTNTDATAAAKHNSAGIPENCAYFETFNSSLASQMNPPAGGLYGQSSLVNVSAGTDFSYDAIALDQWSDVVRYTDAGQSTPNIGAASPAVSRVFTGGGIVESTWLNGFDAVSAVMMHQAFGNEWLLETATASGTDWVVTMPTKRLYVNTVTNGNFATAGSAAQPFNANFFNGSSCDIYDINLYNREEATRVISISPSPLPPQQRGRFCSEANVITFSGSNMLGSPVSAQASVPADLGRAGHAIIAFNQANQVMTPLSTTVNGIPAALRYFGMPIVGFAVQDFSNGNVGGVASNYGGSFVHKYNRRILP